MQRNDRHGVARNRTVEELCIAFECRYYFDLSLCMIVWVVAWPNECALGFCSSLFNCIIRAVVFFIIVAFSIGPISMSIVWRCWLFFVQRFGHVYFYVRLSLCEGSFIYHFSLSASVCELWFKEALDTQHINTNNIIYEPVFTSVWEEKRSIIWWKMKYWQSWWTRVLERTDSPLSIVQSFLHICADTFINDIQWQVEKVKCNPTKQSEPVDLGRVDRITNLVPVLPLNKYDLMSIFVISFFVSLLAVPRRFGASLCIYRSASHFCEYLPPPTLSASLSLTSVICEFI